MTQALRATGLATAAMLLVAMTSCASGKDQTQASGSLTPNSSLPTTATATATPRSHAERASTAASRLVRKYYATVDQVRQESDTSLSQLSRVATSVELSSLKNLVTGERGKGQLQTGNTKVVRMEVQSVNLDNSDPKAGRIPTVQIDICWDVTDVDVVDANGHSIVSPSRPDTGWTRFTVANYHYTTDPGRGWRAATSQDLKKAPCAAS